MRATRPATRRAAVPPLPPSVDLERALRAPARHAQHRQQALGVRAVRLHRAGLDRAAARRRRRRAPGPGHRVRARRDGGLQRPAGRARSLRGRQGRRRGGGAQRRLHRRAAARHHRLPQLRQPGKARGVLPVPRGVPRHRRRLSRVRHAGHRRQRLASTTRVPTGAIDPTPTVGMVGLLERVGAPGAEPLRSPRATTIAHPGCHPRRARRLGLLGGGARVRRRRAPPVDLEAERGLQRLPGGGRGPGPAPVGPRLLGGRPAGRAGRGGDRRALRGGRDSAPTLDLDGYAPGVPSSKGCSTARTRGRVVVIVRSRRTATSWRTLARRARCARSSGRAASGPDRRAGTAGRGPACSVGHLESLRQIYFEAIPRRMQHADADRSAGE